MEQHGMFAEKTVEANQQSQHEERLRLAIKLAEENVEHSLGGPFGAVICRGGEIIAEGANQVVTSNDPTAHAEMVAIRRACQQLQTHNLEGCVIYTSCEPCPMCLGAIYWAHLDHIYFSYSKSDAREVGFDDDFIYEELNRELHERRVGVTQLLKDESKAFEMWAQRHDKVHY